jgi:ferrous iron transport protein A
MPNYEMGDGSMTAVITATPTTDKTIWAEPGEAFDLGQVCCLSRMTAGQTGRIVTVQGEPQLALRILELGLVCGTPVRLLRAAPLGGPIEVEVEGFFLSLRRNEADAITVEV